VFIKLKSSAAKKPTTQKPAAPTKVKKKTGTVNITSGVLNVRKGAGTSYKIIGTLTKGKKITIKSTKGGWYKIKYGKKTGYVSKDFVKV
jgi:uncharacterized protein YgiM (DUF1202 family)